MKSQPGINANFEWALAKALPLLTELLKSASDHGPQRCVRTIENGLLRTIDVGELGRTWFSGT